MVMRKILAIILIVSALFVFVGCEKAPQLYDDISDVQEYIWAEYSDYILFDVVPTIDHDKKTISWTISFRGKYIWNEKKTEQTPPTEVMEGIRECINEYISTDASQLLGVYKSEIVFLRPAKSPFSGTAEDVACSVGWLRNYSNDGLKYDLFSSVDYSFFDEWDCILGKEDIIEIGMRRSQADIVASVVESLPNLKRVYVYDIDVATELSEHYPDIEFV